MLFQRDGGPQQESIMTPRMSGAMLRALLAATAVGLLAPASLAQGQGGGQRGQGGQGGRDGQRQPGRRDFGGGMRMMGGFGGFGPGGMMGQITQAIPRESLEQYEKTLNLTPEQKQAVHAAFEAYSNRLKTEEDAAREAARQTVQDARDRGDAGRGPAAGAGREMMASMIELRKHADEMEASFLSEVKAQLTAEQQALWPKIEQARRREKAANGLMVASGERVDLVKIVDGLNLSPQSRASLDATLEEYASDLDRQLGARTKANDAVIAATTEAFSQPDPDFAAMREKLEPLQEKVSEASSKVQDVNRRYTTKVQSLLPEDKRPAFAKAVKEARFADIYRPTPQMRAFEAALAFDDLQESQRAKIKTLQAQYAKDLEALNARLAAATEKSEAASAGPMTFRPDPEVMDLRRERGELGRDLMDQLRAILTEEQQKKLPEIPQFRGPGGGGPGGAVQRGGEGGRGGRNAQPDQPGVRQNQPRRGGGGGG
jgi:hypothetical protein